MKNVYKIILLFKILSSVAIAKDCSNSVLNIFSIKAFCEQENGQAANCLGSLHNVKKSYIHCENGYYNKENITVQILDCLENGKWSDKVMTCYPKCIEPSDLFNITLLEDDNEKYPEWYTEIRRKNPEEGKINRIPGIIVNERIIATWTSFADSLIDFQNKFSVRVYRTKSKFHDHAIHSVYTDSNGSSIINLVCDDYIKFNNDIKPICSYNKIFDSFDSRLQDHLTRTISYGQTRCKCYPDYYDSQIEISCFQVTNPYEHYRNRTFALTDCLMKNDFVLQRCHIGYQYKKLNNLDYLNYCRQGDWKREDNDCEQICGQIDKDVAESQTRLVYKGNKIDITSFPWHVAIFKNRSSILKPLESKFENICGGTIIHSNIVISAAHCFYNDAIGTIYEASKYVVGAGKSYGNFEVIEKYSFYTGIKEIHVAQNYYPIETLNDVTVLVLNEHLTYSSYIKPACINFMRYKKYSIQNGIEGYIAGWGSINSYDERNNELMTTKLKTVTNDQCKNLVNVYYRSQIVGDKFCAINENKSTACPGDSGGGFLVEDDLGFGKRYYLKGIISTSIDSSGHKRRGSCNDGFTTMFINIQFYQNFIKDIISEDRNANFKISTNVSII